MALRPVLYLDFDGTIRIPKDEEHKFIESPEDIVLIEGVEDQIWRYKKKGFLIVGITNQGGVACGFKTREQIGQEVGATLALFKGRGQIPHPFDHIETCFHHPGGNVWPYGVRSLSRKPGYGMLVQAEGKLYAQGYVVDYNNSLFVGDMEADRLCAQSADVRFMWAEDFLKPHTIELNYEDRQSVEWYFLRSTEAPCEKNVAKWLKRGRGYTYDIRHAEQWPKHIAEGICKSSDTAVMYEVEKVLGNAKAQSLMIHTKYLTP